jgi:hypothetical protein
MTISDDQKWHWGEGTKYAIEGAKAILLINGAAAISILTFIGNAKARQIFLTAAIATFALGALASAMIFLSCYLTQLEYGNVGLNTGPGRSNNWHKISYWAVGISVVFFFVGMVTAAIGLWLLP